MIVGLNGQSSHFEGAMAAFVKYTDAVALEHCPTMELLTCKLTDVVTSGISSLIGQPRGSVTQSLGELRMRLSILHCLITVMHFKESYVDAAVQPRSPSKAY